MAKKFINTLLELLGSDQRNLDENGDIIKAAIIDKAWSIDHDLVRLLLSNDQVKSKFFDEIKGHWIFNINKFIDFISDKNFLSESYTKFRNHVGLAIDGKFLREQTEVNLVWPFKDCVLEGGQTKEEEKRKEIFFSETIAHDEIDCLYDPKILTNWVRFIPKGDEPVEEIRRDQNGIIRENLIIKGNNLTALHSLKTQFRGQVKLIYIDPPYNTGSDSFKYNDNFNHSAWLTFMKNRLEVAKELLREDGILFVQCDDNEQAYLKIILDEIFKGNYLYTLYVQVRYAGKTLVEDMDFQKLIETIHVYSKSSNAKLKKEIEEYTLDKFVWTVNEKGKPTATELGGKKVEIFNPEDYEIVKDEPSDDNLKEIWASGKVLDGNSSGRFFRDYLQGRYKDDGYGVIYKVYGIGGDKFDYRYFTGPKRKGATKGKYYQGVPLKRLENGENQHKLKPIINFYNLADFFGNCRHEGGVELRSGKKPEELLKRIIELATDEGDIVLDYHLGTGTTCAVALKMKRQFIGVEQLEYGKNDCTIRLKNVINGDSTGISEEYNWKGGGDFLCCELMKYNESFIDKIMAAKSSAALSKIYKEIAKNSFLNWYINPKIPNEALTLFKDIGKQKNGLKIQKELLCELLNKNQMYVNLSEIEDKSFGVSEQDMKINKLFYKEV